MTEVSRRSLDLFSEGTRVAAEIFTPADAVPLNGFPAVLLCHGWGGLKDHLALYAKQFARNGFAAMVFDYRGWGESDGRIIAPRTAPRLLEAGDVTLTVRVLREIVDPIDQVADIKACLAVLATEPDVDAARIGIWGSSYGAGHAVWMTGNDERIKCAVAQIGGYDLPPRYRERARERAADKARGEIEPVVPQDGLDGVEGLKGVPDLARMAEHSQLSGAARIKAPTLFLDAEFEELNNRLENGWAAYMMVRQNALAEYDTYPCKHYGVYDEFYQPSVDRAVAWYKKYL